MSFSPGSLMGLLLRQRSTPTLAETGHHLCARYTLSLVHVGREFSSLDQARCGIAIIAASRRVNGTYCGLNESADAGL